MPRCLLFALLLCSAGLPAQVDSFPSVGRYFRYEIPAGWKVNPKAGEQPAWGADLVFTRKIQCDQGSLYLRVIRETMHDALSDSLVHRRKVKNLELPERERFDYNTWTDQLAQLPTTNFVEESFNTICGKLKAYKIAINVGVNDSLCVQLVLSRRDLAERRTALIFEMENLLSGFLELNKAYFDPVKKMIPPPVKEAEEKKPDTRPYILLAGDTFRYTLPAGWKLASVDTFLSVDTIPYIAELKLVPLDTGLAGKVFISALPEKKSQVLPAYGTVPLKISKLSDIDEKKMERDLRSWQNVPAETESESQSWEGGRMLAYYSRSCSVSIYFNNWRYARCSIRANGIPPDQLEQLKKEFTEFISGLGN